jgi:hypothetical protein
MFKRLNTAFVNKLGATYETLQVHLERNGLEKHLHINRLKEIRQIPFPSCKRSGICLIDLYENNTEVFL